MKDSQVNENEEQMQIIETVDENGELIKFELVDLIEYDNKEYGLLKTIKKESSSDQEDQVVIMRLIEGQNDEYTFETIEDDEQFEELLDYIESLDYDEISSNEEA